MRLIRFLRLLLLCSPTTLFAGERLLLDEGWHFQLGDTPEASQEAFDDFDWRRVDLPHDWSIEAPPAADAPSEGHGGYHQTGIGWYRRQLEGDDDPRGMQYRLEFDGVYQNAEVWLNGQRLGSHSYGYTPFSLDLTPYLKHGFGQANTIAVRVDNSAQPNCRWYSGSGIYRHVWLRKLPAVHIEPSSVWIENTRRGPVGKFLLHYKVVNTSDADQSLFVKESFTGPDAQSAGSRVHKLEIGAGQSTDVARVVSIESAEPWSPDSPALYQLSLRLLSTDDTASEAIDSIDHTFGLRSVAVDPQLGFLLNGESIELFGGNVHHDHGPLGAASFDMAEDRRVQLLKAAGFNAVRTSHNPPSEAFLDACDRHGLLVIDEFFDGWAKPKVKRDYGAQFEEMWRDELTAAMVRDRRHPSVVMWSIGNEVYERGDASGVRLTQELADSVRELDSSRPVTIGLNGLGEGKWDRLDPLFESVDVGGYNYETSRYEADHLRVPSRVMYSSESYPRDAFESYMAVRSHPYVVGDFIWSAIDYLGEAAIGRVFPAGETPRKHWEGEHFPWRAAACGDIDLVGRRNPISHYRNIVWDRGEKLHLAVEAPAPDGGPWQPTPWAVLPCIDSWTWAVPEGTPVTVHAYSRFPRVRLTLNGRVVGEAATGESEQFQATFTVPYAPGELVLEGLEDGQATQQVELVSAGEAVSIDLEPEQSAAVADRQSIVFVNVRVVDEAGVTRAMSECDLEFTVNGPAEIVAVGNADPASQFAYTSPECPAYQGRALVVLRSTGKPGTATLVVQGDALPESQIDIEFTRK